jgi:hypothetical protein
MRSKALPDAVKVLLRRTEMVPKALWYFGTRAVVHSVRDLGVSNALVNSALVAVGKHLMTGTMDQKRGPTMPPVHDPALAE